MDELGKLTNELESGLDKVEAAMEPLLAKPLLERARSLPPIEQAKLYSSHVYAVGLLVRTALQLKGIDVKDHPIDEKLNDVQALLHKVQNAATNAPEQSAANAFTKRQLDCTYANPNSRRKRTKSSAQAPDQPAAQAPMRSAAQAPVLSAAQAPVLSAAQAPVLSAAQAPVLSAAQAQVLSAAQVPVLSAAQAPSLSAAQAPMLSASQAPTLSAAQAPMQPAAQAPEQSTTRVPEQSAAQAPKQSATKARPPLPDLGIIPSPNGGFQLSPMMLRIREAQARRAAHRRHVRAVTGRTPTPSPEPKFSR